MTGNDRFSEEQLNAFVDGELDPEEKSRLYNEAEASPELDRQLCQQRKIKELVQHAYADPPAPRRQSRAPLPRSTFLGRLLVAAVLLGVGVSGGLLTHRYLDGQLPADTAAVEAGNYILHVTSDEPRQMRAALTKARYLLESAGAGRIRHVEVVANERGIDLLRSDVTPFADEIRALHDRNVVFYACSRTVERLEQRGIDVRLVPEARQDGTALDRVVLRMKDGWEYIKI
jgi:intracellular sulfur oxidation DsrE/DsrF family protein